MIVLDTNVLSELIRANPAAQVLAWVDGVLTADLRITALTAAELRAGVAALPAGGRSRRLAQNVAALLDDTFAGAVLPFDVDSSEYYAKILAGRRRSGRPIATVDAQIAAICRQHSATLATRDIKGFLDTGVELIDPWALDPGHPKLS